MARTIFWYFVGVILVIGLISLLSLVTFVTLLIFQESLTWDWFVPSIASYLTS